jgi:16S rRNA (uracil1498-N3)-methyltransferase
VRRRFFVERFSDGRAELRGDAAHHLARVLRAEAGQLYELSDGAQVWLARVIRASREKVEFSLVEPLPVREFSVRSTLLLAVVKFDRFEWAVEKATELGVARIVPLAAERSGKNLLAAAGKRAERWRRILIEAAQQSRRVSLPELLPLERADRAFGRYGAEVDVRILLSERPETPLLRELVDSLTVCAPASGCKTEKGNVAPLNRVAVAIGPEGGWTDKELSAATAAGFLEASLGPTILRTETAVTAALAAVNYALG